MVWKVIVRKVYFEGLSSGLKEVAEAIPGKWDDVCVKLLDQVMERIFPA